LSNRFHPFSLKDNNKIKYDTVKLLLQNERKKLCTAKVDARYKI